MPVPQINQHWTKRTVMGMSMLSLVVLVVCVFVIVMAFLVYYFVLEIINRRKNG